MTTKNKSTEIRYGETETNPLRKLRTYILLSSFTGGNEAVYRAVHNLKDNKFFFSNYSKEFYIKTDKLLRLGKISSIKRLLVYNSFNELASLESQRIIGFHKTNSGYSCKTIDNNEYIKLMNKYNINPLIDFGVFGGDFVESILNTPGLGTNVS